jgi:hypothetical protein
MRPIIIGGAVAIIASLAPIAFASDDEVRASGKCTRASSAKIKIKPDDGRLEVEFEVDQNKSGQRWRVKLKDNSEVVFRGRATTRGPSGSFSIERRIPDRSGSDSVKGVARNKSTDERCSAAATF